MTTSCCFKLWEQKGRFLLLNQTCRLKGVIFLYKRNLSHERWTYSLIILEITQSFVTSRRFLNFAIRTHQGHISMKMVAIEKESNCKSQTFLKNSIFVSSKKKNDAKQELLPIIFLNGKLCEGQNSHTTQTIYFSSFFFAVNEKRNTCKSMPLL